MHTANEREYIDSCPLTHVPIFLGDEVVRVRIWRRGITQTNERDYFRDEMKFRDVLDITHGEFDGYDGIFGLTDVKKSTSNNWVIFFHKSAWDLAQTLCKNVSTKLYDPVCEERDEVLRLHQEVQDREKKKVKLDPRFLPTSFPDNMVEFARVVMFAYQTRRSIFPVDGPQADLSIFVNKTFALEAVSMTLLIRARQTAEEFDDALFYEESGVAP